MFFHYNDGIKNVIPASNNKTLKNKFYGHFLNVLKCSVVFTIAFISIVFSRYRKQFFDSLQNISDILVCIIIFNEYIEFVRIVPISLGNCKIDFGKIILIHT